MHNVALRKESVDRNNTRCREIFGHYESLSARRAWIEILSAVLTELLILVALRKESVDRNEGKIDAELCVMWSLSARRAWIEM